MFWNYIKKAEVKPESVYEKLNEVNSHHLASLFLSPLKLTKNEFVITKAQQFPSMLNKVPMSKDEEDISYDVESLFTNIPIKETIDFICGEFYNRKKLKPICKQPIFKKLLYKLTTEFTFKTLLWVVLSH